MSSVAAPATTNAGDPPVPAKGRKKLLIVVAAALLLLVVITGAASALLVLKQRAGAAADEAAEDGAVASQDMSYRTMHGEPPIFVPLQPFVVNLADKDSDRYAQIGLTLEVDDSQFAEEMKLYMPAIRNAILMILAHKHSSELLERSGKQALAAEIMREAVRPMGIEPEPLPAARAGAGVAPPAARRPAEHNPIKRVHFASFIIQ